jgi:galactitol-specific phosphotransferase system IIB component
MQSSNNDLIRTCAPFLFQDEQYQSVITVIENWLSQSAQQKLTKTTQGRRKLENRLRDLIEHVAQQSGTELPTNLSDTTYRSDNSVTPTRQNVIWRELKAELFELLLTMVGDVGITIYEINHAVQAALSVLQIKERQYRRLPKEALEKILDDILPSAEGGRSLVRFIVTELSRLRGHDRYGDFSQNRPVEQSEDMRQRAVRIIALTIAELAQRQLVPIPSIFMLDDEVQEEDLEENVPEESESRNDLIAFSDRVMNSFDRGKPRKKQHMTITVSKRDNKISKELERERKEWNREYGTRFSNSSRSFDSNGGVGPLDVKLPFYRDPRSQIVQLQEQISNRERKLKQRLQHLEQLEQEWQNNDSNSHLKNVSSMMVSMNVLKILKKQQHEQQRIKLMSQLCGDDYVDTDQIQEIYDQILHEKCSQYVETNYKKLLGLQQRKKKQEHFPAFFEQIPLLSKQDIESLLEELSTSSLQQRQVQMWSQMFLDALRDQNPDFSFEDFQKLISSQGPLHNLPPVQSLLDSIDIESNEFLTREEILEEKIHKLYEQMQQFTTESSTESKISSLISQIVDFVFSGEPQAQMERMEEYCLKNLLIYEQEGSQEGHGERFILDFVHSLRDTYQYEQYKPQRIDLPEELLVNQRKQMLRQGAHHFLSLIMPQGIDEGQTQDVKQERYAQVIQDLNVVRMTPEERQDQQLNELLLTLTPEEQQQVLLQRLNWETRQLSSVRALSQPPHDARITREMRSRLFTKDV